MANREQLSLREIELLQALNEIAAKTETISKSIDEKFSALDQKDMEIANLKRELEKYRQENAKFREIIQNWRTRMDKVLVQLGQMK